MTYEIDKQFLGMPEQYGSLGTEQPLVLNPAVDEKWLVGIGVNPAEVWGELQTLVDVDLGPLRGFSEDLKITQRENRARLVGLIGADYLATVCSDSAEPNPITFSVTNFVLVMREVTDLGLDPSVLLKKAPALLHSSPGKITARVSLLNSLGISPGVALKEAPTSFNLSEDTISARVSLYESLGLDYQRMLSKKPRILTISDELFIKKTENLTQLGLDFAAVINQYPNTMLISTEVVNQRFFALRDLGLDPIAIFSRHSTLIGSKSETLARKFAYIKRLSKYLSWDGKVEDFVNKSPNILGRDTRLIGLLARLYAYKGQGLSDLSADQLSVVSIVPGETQIIAAFTSGETGLTRAHMAKVARKYKAKPDDRKSDAKRLVVNRSSQSDPGAKALRSAAAYLG